MEIKIALSNNRVLCFLFGKRLPWSDCACWFSIEIEYYDKECDFLYGRHVWGFQGGINER